MSLPSVITERGIDLATYSALQNSIFPGAKPESIALAIDYCKAQGLDIMQKPVHLVPMNVKDAQTGNKGWRDVVMPGIGLYRILAARSGDYAGTEEPEFGPAVTKEFQATDYNGNLETISVTYPEWCKHTVHKLIGDRVVSFSAKEYWLENYATQSAKSDAPNAMWKKRPFAQLAKCAEAQALRRAWPEIGQQPTAEEMEGKELLVNERDMGNATVVTETKPERPALPVWPEDAFQSQFSRWQRAIQEGIKTHDEIIAMASSKGQLTEDQLAAINDIAPF